MTTAQGWQVLNEPELPEATPNLAPVPAEELRLHTSRWQRGKLLQQESRLLCPRVHTPTMAPVLLPPPEDAAGATAWTGGEGVAAAAAGGGGG